MRRWMGEATDVRMEVALSPRLSDEVSIGICVLESLDGVVDMGI